MVDRYPDYEADSDGSRGIDFGGTPETGNIDTWDTVVLGGLPIRVPMVSFQSLAPFPRKTIFGDATNDSDDYFTTLIYNNLSGGSGVEDMNETTDINRYLIGTLMTRRPNAICKPYLIREYTYVPSGSSARYFVGSLFMDATQLYEDVWVYDGNAYYRQNQTLLGGVIGVPTDNGVLFAGTSSLTRLVWPTGNGYSRFSSGAGFTNTPAEAGLVPAAVSMCNWNGLLIAIDIDGQLWYCSNLDSGWKMYNGAKLPYRQTAYKVLAGFDRGGQKCVYVVTSETVWQFVAEGIALVEIQGFSFPFTNRSGLASCVWNEDLYVASGMNVMRYTGGAKQYIGLDRDDGLPDNYHGYITDLLSTDKGMLAFVTWEGIDSNTSPRYNSIHEFSGIGWQMIRQMPDPATPRSMGISKAGQVDRYRLYFGTGSTGSYHIEYLDYPTGPVFPRQVPTYENFQPGTFFLISSWFDAQLSGYVKLANAVEVKLSRMKEMSKFRVYAQIDDEDNPWLFLGETSRDGVTAFSFGDAGGQEALGETFIKIRFRYELEDHNFRTPYIEYINFSCVKISYPLYTWTFPIDYTRANDGMEPDDVHYILDELYTAGRMTTFMWKNRLYRGKVTQYYGSGAPGKRNLTSGSVSVLGLPEAISKIWLAKNIR